MDTLATTIRMQRGRLGLSQRALADRAGMSEGGIANLEQGSRPQVTTIFKLADALDLDPATLLRLADQIDAPATPDHDASEAI